MPNVADVEPIAAMLAGLALGKPLRHGALTVIPLLTEKDDEPDWLTLPELGADGEEFPGAEQHRIPNTTVLIRDREAAGRAARERLGTCPLRSRSSTRCFGSASRSSRSATEAVRRREERAPSI